MKIWNFFAVSKDSYHFGVLFDELFLQEFSLFLAIWLVVAVVSIVTAVSDYQKEGEFLKKQLIEENSKVVTVLRDGKKIPDLHRNHIKVGDIIQI
jgi:hypothetical protein